MALRSTPENFFGLPEKVQLQDSQPPPQYYTFQVVDHTPLILGIVFFGFLAFLYIVSRKD